MNRIIVFFFIGGIIPCFFAQADSPKIEYYTPDNLLRFADYLYDSGDYLRAAGEYQRYLFYTSCRQEDKSSIYNELTTQNADGIFRQIARCYQLGGQSERAIHIFEKLLIKNPNSQVSSTIRYEIGYTYFLMERYEKSLSYVEETLSQISDFNEQRRFKQLVGFNYLKQHRWSDAKYLFDSLAKVSEDEDSRKEALQYKQYAFKGEGLPHKSPFLAGGLSTIVPGLGKVYSNRFQDGAFSFLWIGFMGWLAYDGFHRDGLHSVKGWIFAPVGGVFYLGNIYGSVIAARIHNRDIERDFLVNISFESF